MFSPTHIVAVTLKDGAEHVAAHPECKSALVLTPRAVRRLEQVVDGPFSFCYTDAFVGALNEPEREGYSCFPTAHRLYRDLQRRQMRAHERRWGVSDG